MVLVVRANTKKRIDMQSIPCPLLPSDTARAVESVMGYFHPYLNIGNRLDEYLADLPFGEEGERDQRLVGIFWPLSVMSVLQFWEDLTDSQVINAVRSRMDLKYALHLPMNYPGLEAKALCGFRQRLLHNQGGMYAFQELVCRLSEYVNNPEKAHADTGKVLTAICTLNRIEMVVETMRNAVEALAASHTEWLRSIALPHWYSRYNSSNSLLLFPRSFHKTKDLLMAIGKDGQHLLDAVDGSDEPGLALLPEILTLRQEWPLHFGGGLILQEPRPQDCASCPKNKNGHTRSKEVLYRF